MTDKQTSDWKQCSMQVFWGEIAPSDHLVQIYESDEAILDSLEGFVESGLKAGESVILIATDGHLNALNERMIKHGFDLDALSSTDQYIPLNVEETLTTFMVNSWPDDILFMEMVTKLVDRARGKNQRKVRAFGEMVAVLWAQGRSGATVQLEHLWNKFCETEAFCLFCAYPKSGFTQDADKSIRHICSTHTKMVLGVEKSKTEVFYKNVDANIRTAFAHLKS